MKYRTQTASLFSFTIEWEPYLWTKNKEGSLLDVYMITPYPDDQTRGNKEFTPSMITINLVSNVNIDILEIIILVLRTSSMKCVGLFLKYVSYDYTEFRYVIVYS